MRRYMPRKTVASATHSRSARSSMYCPRSRQRAATRTATRKDSEVASTVRPGCQRSVSACASSSMIGP
ncbi:hypothetical protein SVIOM342S_07235 [Streptomyces violaceorubidus]